MGNHQSLWTAVHPRNLTKAFVGVWMTKLIIFLIRLGKYAGAELDLCGTQKYLNKQLFSNDNAYLKTKFKMQTGEKNQSYNNKFIW